MTDISRRRVLKVLGLAPLATVLDAQQPPGTQQQPRTPHQTPNQPAQQAPAQPPKNAPKHKFFTAKEARTASVLADDIIPRDEKSGSATDAGVIDFIDFNLTVPEASDGERVAMRGGLRWLDTETKRRYGVAYASATTAQRHAILDDVAFPDKAPPELSAGVAFFSRFRDMVASGFYSSAIGWKDVQYIGNTFNPNWNGCPQAALDKLGVSQALMDTRVQPQ
jgi:gluconate 2-dehydrogenase gamma chain